MAYILAYALVFCAVSVGILALSVAFNSWRGKL
jgi:hypothetical protein